MLTEYQEIKIGLMKRANWIKNGCINILTGQSDNLYIDKPKTKLQKRIRELEIERDNYLSTFDIELAIPLQLEINKLKEN